jgi:capsular exopolysaccharide synthesis family protein
MQEQQTVGSLAGLRGVAMAERQRNVRFNSLKREVETNKAFYDGLLQRYKEVAAASGAPAANVTLIDRAVAPLNPSSPNTGRNTALSGVVGLILAFLVGAVREGKNQTVRMPDDIRGALNVRSLGVVPRLSRHEAREFQLKSWTLSNEEAHHSVAVAIAQSAGGLPKTLLITSSSASEGKSTTAIGLANSFTAMGKRVLLIDGDLRHPTIQGDAADPAPGIADLLSGQAAAEDAVQQDSPGGYDFVAAGRDRVNPVSILKTQQIADVLEEVSAGYDITIIDGPPILGLADAVLLASAVDAVLLVVEANRLHWTQVDNALSRLPDDRIIGAVVTKFDAKAAGVPYGGTDYYSY